MTAKIFTILLAVMVIVPGPCLSGGLREQLVEINNSRLIESVAVEMILINKEGGETYTDNLSVLMKANEDEIEEIAVEITSGRKKGEKYVIKREGGGIIITRYDKRGKKRKVVTPPNHPLLFSNLFVVDFAVFEDVKNYTFKGNTATADDDALDNTFYKEKEMSIEAVKGVPRIKSTIFYDEDGDEVKRAEAHYGPELFHNSWRPKRVVISSPERVTTIEFHNWRKNSK